jgi:hypothetical protein
VCELNNMQYYSMCVFTTIVGDSGYPLEPWLLTPVMGQQLSAAEAAYNMAHIKTRNCIERAIGVLKSRFRCLDKSGGMKQYNHAHFL